MGSAVSSKVFYSLAWLTGNASYLMELCLCRMWRFYCGRDPVRLAESRAWLCTLGWGLPTHFPVVCCWGSLAWTLSSPFENHNNSNDTNSCHLMTLPVRISVSSHLTPQPFQEGPVTSSTLQMKKLRLRQIKYLIQQVESGVGPGQPGRLPSCWQICPLSPSPR